MAQNLKGVRLVYIYVQFPLIAIMKFVIEDY